MFLNWPVLLCLCVKEERIGVFFSHLQTLKHKISFSDFFFIFYKHLIRSQNHDAPAKAAVKSSNPAEYVSSSIFIRSNLSIVEYLRD